MSAGVSRARRGPRGRAIALAVAALACASPPSHWRLDRFTARHPAIDEIEGHSLGEALPYFTPSPEGLALFLCRWPDDVAIPVWLPPDASTDEKLLLERALAAWEGAGLGLRFASSTWQGRPPLAGVVFEFVKPGPGADADTASALADCAVPRSTEADPSAGAVDAELQYASIHLTRVRRDELGREVALSSSELMGAALHELAHALGFAGHVARGQSVLVRRGQVQATRRYGERIEAGERLEAPSLAALYAAPSGARVGFLPLRNSDQDVLELLATRAEGVGLRGPYARVSESSARLLWRDEYGNAAAVVVLDWPGVLQEPTRFEPRLNRAARFLIENPGAL